MYLFNTKSEFKNVIAQNYNLNTNCKGKVIKFL